MKKVFSELPYWTFHIDEVSAGVYEVSASDVCGRNISAKGIDVDKTIEKCKADAKKMLVTSVH